MLPDLQVRHEGVAKPAVRLAKQFHATAPKRKYSTHHMKAFSTSSSTLAGADTAVRVQWTMLADGAAVGTPATAATAAQKAADKAAKAYNRAEQAVGNSGEWKQQCGMEYHAACPKHSIASLLLQVTNQALEQQQPPLAPWLCKLLLLLWQLWQLQRLPLPAMP